MKASLKTQLIVMFSILVLSACGGGGGGASDPVVTPVVPPVETLDGTPVETPDGTPVVTPVVTPATLVSIAVTPSSSSIAVAATQQFTATGTHADATTEDFTTLVTWSSSNSSVATINSSGLATAVGAGSTAITATSGALFGSSTLTVTAATAAGGKIAFTARHPNDHLAPEIYVMDADGHNKIRVTPNSSGAYEEADILLGWSPDAAKVIFTSLRDGYDKRQLYTVNVDGSEELKLTAEDNLNVNPAWSPDGTKIAFMSDRSGMQQIYLMNPDGSNQTRFTDAVDPYRSEEIGFYHPAWSPDGSSIACNSNWYYLSGGIKAWGGIYVFRVSDGVYTQLTHYEDINPAWSPGGDKIAFVRPIYSSGGILTTYIYVMDSDGDNQTQLAPGTRPAWSPDGSKIAFVRDDNGYRLYVMNANGSNVVLLDNTSGASVTFRPSWSPDGSKLVFAGLNNEIYTINPDGTGLSKVTTEAYSLAGPQWSP